MHQTNIKRVDLNLLVVFDAVARTRSVTMAAEQLALSQPAVSHALNRLRDLMHDPLFVRSGRGLTPTPRAEEMVGPIKQLLVTAEGVLSATTFDPPSTARSFRIGASDYAMMTIVPGIVRKLRSAAPHSRIEITTVGADLLKRFEGGELDLAFVGAIPPDGALLSRELFNEHFVGLVCQHHPIVRGQKNKRHRIRLSDYLDHPHVAVSFGTPEQSPIDKLLAAQGKRRRVAMTTPNFAANIASLIGTDLIMSLPSRLATAVKLPGLTTFKLPLAVPPYPYLMTWHRRSDTDPGGVWFRTVVVESASLSSQRPNAPRGR